MLRWAYVLLVAVLTAVAYTITPAYLSDTVEIAFFIFISLTVVAFLTADKLQSRYISNINLDTIMNELQIKGNWNEKKGKLKQEYAELTDEDLEYIEGKEEELVGRVQQRLGTTKEEAQNIINRA